MKLLGHSGAADDRPALEHGDLEARTREIRGARKAIVPAADD